MTLHINAPAHEATICEALYDVPTGEIGRELERALSCRACGSPIAAGRKVCSPQCAGTLGGRAGTGASKRHPVYGTQNGAAVLTPRRVRRIRALAQEGWAGWEIATELGVHVRTVQEVLNGTTWGHVE